MAKILLVCDDDWAACLTPHILDAGHSCDHVSSGFRALDVCKTGGHDLMVLGWQLSDASGRCILVRYRAVGGSMPVFVLTATDCLLSRVHALDDGADDVLNFPPHEMEMKARVSALIRRFGGHAARMLEAGDLRLDVACRKVFKNDREIPLLSKEYKLLEFLIRHQNQSFTAEAIMERLWKSESAQSTDTVRTHIKTLRQKLGDSTNGNIVTRRGLGYAFVTSELQCQSA
jgi:DNA-binding response OmpR family regulator